MISCGWPPYNNGKHLDPQDKGRCAICGVEGSWN